MSNFLEISNLSKSYSNNLNEINIFNGFSLEVQANSIVSILGPSGCGKSTLLKLITGLELFNNGKILINKKPIEDYSSENKISYVFQKSIFFPWKTIFKNLLFPLELSKGKISDNDRENVENLLGKFKIQESKDSYPHELSGGMLQRANVARALTIKPQLLLLDEPFNSIDEFTRESFWIDFRKIWKESSLTVILVSHDIREAIFFGDEVVILPNKPISKAQKVKIDMPKNRSVDLLSSKEFFNNIQRVRKYIKVKHEE